MNGSWLKKPSVCPWVVSRVDDEHQALLRTKGWQAWSMVLDYDEPALLNRCLYAEFCGVKVATWILRGTGAERLGFRD